MTYPNAIFSAFAFIGFVMCAIPLPWHLQAWNTGTCLYMIWTGLGCLNQFINSIIWNRNAINWAPVWCDISVRLFIGVAFAIPAASLCINRRLYYIACVRTVTVTKSDKRRAVLVDLAIGLGLPILGIILQYIPQSHRFNIFEDVGCYHATYYTWPTYPLVILPPIFIGLVSGTYAMLTIIAFHKNRSQFNSLLSTNSNITSNRFIRLMCLAGAEILFNIPTTLAVIGVQVHAARLSPWISWANVHSNFSRVDQFPSLLWRAPSNYLGEVSLELSRWSVIFCAFVFFGFFGFADEARKHYRSTFQSVAKRVGISTGSFGSGANTIFGSNGMKSKTLGSPGRVRPILPVFVHREMLRRQDSMGSFTNFTSTSVSVADVDAAINEKSEKNDPCATLSYGSLSIADVGGTLADTKVDTPSPITCPASSPAPGIPYPTPMHTHQHSRDTIEISSVRHGSVYIEAPNSLVVPTSNSAQSQSQPTNQNKA